MKKYFDRLSAASCCLYARWILLLLFTGQFYGAFAQPARTFIANGRTIRVEDLDRKVRRIMEEVGVPGLSLAIINGDKIVYYHTYGFKDIQKKEPVDSETIFEACSLSKNYLAFVAYQLVDEGKLDLDKPMYQYLDYEPLKHDSRYKLITTRMVLSHCSGIENWKHENNPDTMEILSDPGAKFIYSGEGYQYLAKIIELILQQPYIEYMQERVFKRLKLMRTFARYTDGGAYPTDYAIGYDNFGKPIDIWKNLDPVPASGIHTTAEDHATLITAFFNGRYLSNSRIKDIIKPMIRLHGDKVQAYYGPGFEVSYLPQDTVIAHGGNNPGFKTQVFYSITRRCGFVYMSNGNLGKLISIALSEATVRLDVAPFFADDFYEQYPCAALALLKVYREKGDKAMLAGLERMKAKTNGKIGINTLNQLGDIIAAGGNLDLAKKLAEENTKLYPESSQAFFLLGAINFYQKEYQSAYTNLRRAKDLHYNDDPSIDYYIKLSSENIGMK